MSWAARIGVKIVLVNVRASLMHWRASTTYHHSCARRCLSSPHVSQFLPQKRSHQACEKLLDLSSVGFSWTGVRLVQVSGVSCVSHAAVHMVGSSKAIPVSRETMRFLNVSSVPAFGLFSAPLRHSLSQHCARGLSLTYLSRSLCPTQYLLYGIFFPITIHDVLVPRS